MFTEALLRRREAHCQKAGSRNPESGPNLRRLRKVSCLAISMLPILIAPPTYSAESAGTVKTSKGSVTIERGARKLPAAAGAPVEVSDRVVTGKDGNVGITLRDNTLISAGSNANLELRNFAYNAQTHSGTVNVHLKKGSLAAISGKIAKHDPGNVRFSTPTVTLGVRGTEFIIDAGLGAD